MNIDILAGTDQQAVVAKALEARRPGGLAREYVRDAQAVLLALDEYHNAREFAGELVEAPDTALMTHDEVLRADALNSASRLLAGIGEPLADHVEDEDVDGLAQFVGHLWTKVAAYGEEYLRTGKVTPSPDGSDDSAEPAPSQDATGAAEGEA